MQDQADIVICGAGFAGLSAAYFLAARGGLRNILVIDERPPLSLTSDHSTECYRSWWPDEAMVGLMNRSIDLLEELANSNENRFHLNRRGYLYCSADLEKAGQMEQEAQAISQLGAGPLRIHPARAKTSDYRPLSSDGYANQPEGADLLLDPNLIRAHFPYLSHRVKAALHVRRAGWLSAQQLGMFFLEQARSCGVRLLQAEVAGIDTSGGAVRGVRLADDRLIPTRRFVNAAGPFAADIGAFMGVDLPIYHELHLKLAFDDRHEALARQAPLVIWSDPQRLDWTAEERTYLLEDGSGTALLEMLPSGLHIRPEGGPGSSMVLALWEYTNRTRQPVFPIPDDPLYAEVVLRGLVRMVPGMRAYVEKMPRPRLDGGYYTRTKENRPLICRLPVDGGFMVGALSGFGVMASCAAGELLAAHVCGDPLPLYADAFSLERYQDPEYLKKCETLANTGQL